MFSLVDYYFDVLNGLEKHGEEFITNERNRFNVMMANGKFQFKFKINLIGILQVQLLSVANALKFWF